MGETTFSDGLNSARKVGAPLGIGILILPWFFAWFLLREGYSTFARIIGFGWMVASVVFVIASGGSSDQRGIDLSTPPAAEVQAVPEEVSTLSRPQKNAVRSARQYLSMSGFSRDGLITQLSSSAGDGYDVADATAAVDSLGVDWNENATKSARQYLSMSGFSCQGLIEQLSSSAGDKYTVSEATYGAQQAGACS